MIRYEPSRRQPEPKLKEAAAHEQQIRALAEQALLLRKDKQYDQAEDAAWQALAAAGIDSMRTLLSIPPNELPQLSSPGAHFSLAQSLKVIAMSEGKRWRRYTRAFALLERAISLAPDSFLLLQDLDWAIKETLRAFSSARQQSIRCDKKELTRQLEVTVQACETFLEIKYAIIQGEMPKEASTLSLDQKAECAWALDNICNLACLRLAEYASFGRQTSEFERWLTKGSRAGQAILSLYGLPTEARFLEVINPESFPELKALGPRELKRIEKALSRLQALYNLAEKTYDSRVLQKLKAGLAPLVARAEAENLKKPPDKRNPAVIEPGPAPSFPNSVPPPPSTAAEPANEIPPDFTWLDLREVSQTTPPPGSILAKVFDPIPFDLQLKIGRLELQNAAAAELKDYQLLKQFQDPGLVLLLKDVHLVIQRDSSAGEIPTQDLLTMVRYQALLDKLKKEWQTNNASLKEQISKSCHSLEAAIRHHHLGKAHTSLTRAFAAVLKAWQETK